MIIKILGSGCPKCRQLEENVKKAVKDMALKEAQVEHVYDLEKIIEMGVMTTPAIAVGGKVLAAGKILSSEEIKEIIEENKNE